MGTLLVQGATLWLFPQLSWAAPGVKEKGGPCGRARMLALTCWAGIAAPCPRARNAAHEHSKAHCVR